MTQPQPQRVDDNPRREGMEETGKEKVGKIVTALTRTDRKEIGQKLIQLGTPRSTQQPLAQEGTAIIASRLAPEFGSDTKYIAKEGAVDIRRSTYVRDEIIPAGARSAVRSKIESLTAEELKYFDVIHEYDEEILNRSRSRGGFMLTKMVDMTAVSTPGVRQPREDPKKPGWVSRNLTHRDWEEKDENQ